MDFSDRAVNFAKTKLLNSDAIPTFFKHLRVPSKFIKMHSLHMITKYMV